MKGIESPTAGLPETFARGEVHWQVLPEWQELLLGPDGLRLGSWLDQGQASVVKHGAHRTVYRVDLPHRTIFLKHYRCQDLLDLGRHLLRATASRREYRKAVELARRHVPTVQPVAIGEERRAGLLGDNFLITEGVPNSIALNTYLAERLPRLPADEQRRIRRKLADALAHLCASAHRAGVFHDDFHAGNVLVCLDSCHGQTGDSRAVELCLLDLPGVRLSGPLNWTRSRDSLIMLNSDFGTRASLGERWRFWRAYLRERRDLELPNLRQAAAELARRTRDYACRLMRGRAKRALRTNRDFYVLETSTAKGHAVTQVSPTDLVRLLEEPERLLRENSHRPVKLSQRSLLVRAELTVGGARLPIAYKRWRTRRWWHALLGRSGRRRALEAWYLGQALVDRGIPTPRPLAACVSRGARAAARGYLATAWIEDAEDFEQFRRRLATLPRGERDVRAHEAAEKLGSLIGRLHVWRMAHSRLSLAQFLFVERGDGVDVLLQEMDGLAIRRRLSYREQVDELAALAASAGAYPSIGASHRRRFLAAYLAQLKPQDGNAGRLWRDVAARMASFPTQVIVNRPDRSQTVTGSAAGSMAVEPCTETCLPS